MVDRYRLLFDASPLPSWVYDRDTLRFLAANQAALEAYGYTLEEFLSLTLLDIRPPEDAPLLCEAVVEIGTGKPGLSRWRHRRRDGTLFPVEVRSRDIDYSPLRARMIVAEDLTERVQAEERIAEAHRLLEEAQKVAHLGSWSLDPDQKLNWSKEAYRIFGLPDGTPIDAAGFFALVHPDDRQSLHAPGQALRERDEPYSVVHRIVRPDGSERWVHELAHAERDSDGNVLRLLGTVQDVTEQRRAELEREEARAQVRREQHERDRFFSLSRDFFCVVNVQGCFVRVNPAFLALGYPEQQLLGKPFIDFVHPDDVEPSLKMMAEVVSGASITHFENRYRRRDGGLIWLAWSASPNAEEGVVYASARDVTGQRALEQQLRQSQKMEAVGRLAGGVAHDFNNMLTVIIGVTEGLALGLPAESPMREELLDASRAGHRAAALTKQLLAFSRKQRLQPRVLDLNEQLRASAKMLRRVIGEDIELVLALEERDLFVRADPGQLEQVLLNLAVNSRDAMPGGGRLTISSSRTRFDPAEEKARSLPPGPCACIAVTDTGMGMESATLEHLFEPFFTTKEPGKGTGLGLSTVYGVVRQSGGQIWATSTKGSGTTFQIALPLSAQQPAAAASLLQPRQPAARGGTETILLVEDEPLVRQLIRRALLSHGYHVLEATDGTDALKVFAGHLAAIHLLLTDVVMPGLNGRMLAARLLAEQPLLPVIFMSGYAEELTLDQRVLGAKQWFVDKPVAPEALARKIREVLDSVRTGG